MKEEEENKLKESYANISLEKIIESQVLNSTN